MDTLDENDKIECVACGYSSTDKTRFEFDVKNPYNVNLAGVVLCNVCCGSFAKFAYLYAEQYIGRQDIFFNISACTNMIIDEIRNRSKYSIHRSPRWPWWWERTGWKRCRKEDRRTER